MAYGRDESLTPWATARRRCSLIISDTDTTFNFVAALLQSPAYSICSCDKADDDYGGRAARPCAAACWTSSQTSARSRSFEKLIATIRSREISASIILQSQSQLKSHLQGRGGNHTVGNCRQHLVFGRAREIHAQRRFRSSWGRETIDSYNHFRKPRHARFPMASVIRNWERS